MALVLKSWVVDENPKDGVYVKIVGRKPGIFAWFLSLMGIDPTTTFIVEEDEIRYESGSWAGQNKVVVPMKSITRSFYGYEKPWKEALVITLILLPVFGIGLIVGPLYYIFNKELQLGFVEMSGWAGAIVFKRSVIEGQNIDEKAAYRVHEIVQKVMKAQR